MMFAMTPGSGGGRIAESVKARIRKASLLQNEDFTRLLEFTSAGDIAVYLAGSAYGPVLKDFALEKMRRADLEFLLGVTVLADGVAFGHYGGQGDRKLLDLWLEHFDVALFKNHLRQQLRTAEWGGGADAGAEAGTPDDVLDMVADFRLTLVDKDKLFAATALKDIIMSVKRDGLRSALLEAVRGQENEAVSQGAEYQRTGFNVGMILERHYFNNLYTAVAGLGGTEGRFMRLLVGTRVDLMNIYWVYRARRFFKMAPEEALTLIMKARYLADFKLLTKVAFADPAAVPAALSGTPYAPVFDVESGETALREVEIECRIYKFLFAAAERVFRSGSNGFQNVAAYLVLKELEIRDIIAIVESVRYGFDRSKTHLLLVRPLSHA